MNNLTKGDLIAFVYDFLESHAINSAEKLAAEMLDIKDYVREAEDMYAVDNDIDMDNVLLNIPQHLR